MTAASNNFDELRPFLFICGDSPNDISPIHVACMPRSIADFIKIITQRAGPHPFAANSKCVVAHIQK